MNKKLIIIIIVICVLAAGVILLRILSGEDSWICKDGEWVKHGNPSIAQPQTRCESGSKAVEKDKNALHDFKYKLYFTNTKENPEMLDCTIVSAVERSFSSITDNKEFMIRS